MHWTFKHSSRNVQSNPANNNCRCTMHYVEAIEFACMSQTRTPNAAPRMHPKRPPTTPHVPSVSPTRDLFRFNSIFFGYLSSAVCKENGDGNRGSWGWYVQVPSQPIAAVHSYYIDCWKLQIRTISAPRRGPNLCISGLYGMKCAYVVSCNGHVWIIYERSC